MSQNDHGDTKDLTEIKLESVAEIDQKDEKVKIRTPKRIVHCSDGVYEEYSDDEDGMYCDSYDESCCCGLFILKKNSVMFKLYGCNFCEKLKILTSEDEHHVDWLELLTIDEPSNEQKMSYPWWATFKAARGLGHVLKYMDSWGEWLADEFGLLRPVYQDLIDQHAELVSDFPNHKKFKLIFRWKTQVFPLMNQNSM